MTEHELTALKSGDREAFSRLVRQHHRALLALVTPMVGASDAEEVVQNGWIKAYQAIAGFESRSQIRTWLGRIVINEAKMKLRGGRREFTFSDFETEDEEDPFADRFIPDGHWGHAPSQWDLGSPESLLSTEQLADCLDRLLQRMPDNQRAVLEMKDSADFSFDEICNETGLSASNVRVILHRARSQLFSLVDHYQETGEC